MKSHPYVLGLALLVLVFLLFAAASKSYCFSCWNTTCLNSSVCGGDGCVCIRRGMGEMGYCASIQ